MKRKLLTEDIFQQMYIDYTNSLSATDIAKKYDFSVKTVQLHFHKRRIYFSTAVKFTPQELESIVLDYQNGMRPYELAEKYHRRAGTIIEKLKCLGLYEDVHHHFTDEEVRLLTQYYRAGDWCSIHKLLPDVKRSTIYSKMSALGISADTFHWQKDDIDVLMANYEKMYGQVRNLVELFGGKYTYSAIVTKAEKLGLKTRDYWSDSEVAIMREWYHKRTLDEMMLMLPRRNRKSIVSKALKLGLKNVCKYQDWEVQFIIDNWKTMSDKEMAKALSKTFRGVKAKRESMGLSRQNEHSCYSNICEFLRANNTPWKNESMKECNYRCMLTGERFDDIHHVHSFNLIVAEVIETLDIDTNKSMSDFTDTELSDILDVFRQIQSTYPLGICLNKSIHDLFHKIYGYGNTNEQHWNSFVTSYENNQYANLIDVA